MKAIKIIMRNINSNNPRDIQGFMLELDEGIINQYSVEKLYNYLMENSSRKVYVGESISYLVPIRSLNGQKYIRSSFNANTIDELMKLPRC